MAMITSIKPTQDSWPADIKIEDLELAGLPVPSIIRFKMFTLDHRLILDRLGKLAKADLMNVQQKLKEILSLR
jgi:mRNA interferase MazF